MLSTAKLNKAIFITSIRLRVVLVVIDCDVAVAGARLLALVRSIKLKACKLTGRGSNRTAGASLRL